MPLLWLSSAFLCGILLGEWLGWPLGAWLLLAALALGVELVRRLPPVRRFRPKIEGRPSPFLALFPPPPIPALLLLVALFLGAARFQSAQITISPDHVAYYNDRDVPFIVEGLIVGYPDGRDAYTNLKVHASRIHPQDELSFTPVEGLLLARVPPGGGWRYGDRLRLDGWLRTPSESEEFSYREYLARQGVASILYCRYDQDCGVRLGRGQGNPLLAAIYDLRDRALAVVYQLFPDPVASLLAGILLGVESGIPQDVQEAFNDTGTTHIIAISGFNFAIVASLFALLFRRWLGRWRGMLAAFLGMALYAMLAGAGAAVVRAAIMGLITQFGIQLGRRQSGANSLLFVAAVMALFNPYVPWDVSFQLSFMATLGLILYAGPFAEAFTNAVARHLPLETAQRLAAPAGEYLLFTLAAQITTLPVVIYHFQRFSLVSLIANPFILPAQPPLLVLGGLAVILGLIFVPIGQLAAYLVWPFAAYTIRVVELLAHLPSASLSLGRVGLSLVLFFYVILFGWTFYGGQLRAWAARLGGSLPRAAGFALATLALLAVVVWQVGLAAPDGRLHLTLLDVGSGDGLLIQTPTGRYVLVDGGPSANRLSDALGRRLPLTFRKLDYQVVAAANDEQLGSLPRVLERFPPGEVLWAGSTMGSYSARQLRRYLAEAQIPVTIAQEGQTLHLGEGAALRLLSASSKGAVLLVEWGNFRALLPIGLDFASMESLMADDTLGPVTALLLAEGGCAPLNPPEWIARWQPQVVLLSVAAEDELGCPDPETVEAVAGYTLLRTDLNGWIELTTDGVQMWVVVDED